MIITCVMSVPISYTDENGKPKTVVTRPGSHNYPMLDHKDPKVAEQLRVYRKHHRIGFDELLASDKEILKKIDPKDPDKIKKLAKAVQLKPSPVGKKVKGKKRGGNTKPSPAAAPKNAKVEPKKDKSESPR